MSVFAAEMFHLNRIGPSATKAGVVDVMDFDKVTSLIGRNKGQVDFVLDSSNHIASQYISRLHARVVRQDKNSHRLFDDSLNGIFINNTKIMGSVVLQEGDIVTFGHPYGVRLKPGVWARQPDSEYQFIFERCNCDRAPLGKPTVLEDRVNTHPSMFKVPQQMPTKVLASREDNKAKLSSTTTVACVSSIHSTPPSKEISDSLTESLSGSDKTPPLGSSSSEDSSKYLNMSLTRNIESANNVSEHKSNLENLDLNESVALAEASSIINKCMTTIAGMTKALSSITQDTHSTTQDSHSTTQDSHSITQDSHSITQDSERSDSTSRHILSDASPCQVKEFESPMKDLEQASSKLNASSLDETKVLDTSTDKLLNSSCDESFEYERNNVLDTPTNVPVPVTNKEMDDTWPVTKFSLTSSSVCSSGLLATSSLTAAASSTLPPPSPSVALSTPSSLCSIVQPFPSLSTVSVSSTLPMFASSPIITSSSSSVTNADTSTSPSVQSSTPSTLPMFASSPIITSSSSSVTNADTSSSPSVQSSTPSTLPMFASSPLITSSSVTNADTSTSPSVQSSATSTTSSQCPSSVPSTNHNTDSVTTSNPFQDYIRKVLGSNKTPSPSPLDSHQNKNPIGNDNRGSGVDVALVISPITTSSTTCGGKNMEIQIKHSSLHSQVSGTQCSNDQPSTSYSSEDNTYKKDKTSSPVNAKPSESPSITKNQKVKSANAKTCNVHNDSSPSTSSTHYVGCVTRGRKRKQKQVCTCCVDDRLPKGKKSLSGLPLIPNSNSKSKKKRRGAENSKQNSKDETNVDGRDPDVVYLLSVNNGVICISDDEKEEDVSYRTKTTYDGLSVATGKDVWITLDEDMAAGNGTESPLEQNSGLTEASDKLVVEGNTGNGTESPLEQNSGLTEASDKLVVEGNTGNGTESPLEQNSGLTEASDKLVVEGNTGNGTESPLEQNSGLTEASDKLVVEGNTGNGAESPLEQNSGLTEASDKLNGESSAVVISNTDDVMTVNRASESVRENESVPTPSVSRVSQNAVNEGLIQNVKSDEETNGWFGDVKEEMITNEIHPNEGMTTGEIYPKVNVEVDSKVHTAVPCRNQSVAQPMCTTVFGSDIPEELERERKDLKPCDIAKNIESNRMMKEEVVASENTAILLMEELKPSGLENDWHEIVEERLPAMPDIKPHVKYEVTHQDGCVCDSNQQPVGKGAHEEMTPYADCIALKSEAENGDESLIQVGERPKEEIDYVKLETTNSVDSGSEGPLQYGLGHEDVQDSVSADIVPQTHDNVLTADTVPQTHDNTPSADIVPQTHDNVLTADNVPQTHDNDNTAPLKEGNDDIPKIEQRDDADVIAHMTDCGLTVQTRNDDEGVTSQTEADDVVSRTRISAFNPLIQQDYNDATPQSQDVTPQIIDTTLQCEDLVMPDMKQADVAMHIEEDGTSLIREKDATWPNLCKDITPQITGENICPQLQDGDGDASPPIQDENVTKQIPEDCVTAVIQDYEVDITPPVQGADVTPKITEDDVTSDITDCDVLQNDDVMLQLEEDDAVTLAIQNNSITLQIQGQAITRRIAKDAMTQLQSEGIWKVETNDNVTACVDCDAVELEMKENEETRHQEVMSQTANVSSQFGLGDVSMVQGKNDDSSPLAKDMPKENEECFTNFADATFVTSTPADDNMAKEFIVSNRPTTPVSRQSVMVVKDCSTIVDEQNAVSVSLMNSTSVLDDLDSTKVFGGHEQHEEEFSSIANRGEILNKNQFVVRLSENEGELVQPGSQWPNVCVGPGVMEEDGNGSGAPHNEDTECTQSGAITMSKDAGFEGQSRESRSESEEEEYDSNGETESEKRETLMRTLKEIDEDYSRLDGEESEGSDGDGREWQGLQFSESQEFDVLDTPTDVAKGSGPCLDGESEVLQKEGMSVELCAGLDSHQLSLLAEGEKDEATSLKSEDSEMGGENGMAHSSVGENGMAHSSVGGNGMAHYSVGENEELREDGNDLTYSESQEFGLDGLDTDNTVDTVTHECVSNVSAACCPEMYEVAMDDEACDDDVTTCHIENVDDVATCNIEDDVTTQEVRGGDVKTHQIVIENEDVTTFHIEDDDVTAQSTDDDDDVTTQEIEDDNVTTQQIEDGSVTTGQVEGDDVTTKQIDDDDDDDVTTKQIDYDDDVTTKQIDDDDDDDDDDDVTTKQIEDDDDVTTKQIDDDDDVTTQQIDDDGVTEDDDETTRQIEDDDVTTQQIEDDDVTTQQIEDDDVTTQLIEDDDVRTQQTEDDDVTTQQIEDDDDVTTQQLKDDDVTTKQIDDDDEDVTTKQIEDDGVTEDDDITTRQIEDDDVTMQQTVDDDDVTTQLIEDDDATAQQIEVDDDVTTQQLKDDDVTTQQIDVKDDDDVTTQQIEDDDVTTKQIDDDGVTTKQINDDDYDDDVTTKQIDDDDVTTKQIEDDDITTRQIEDDDVTTQQVEDNDVTMQQTVDDDDVTTQQKEDDDVTTQHIEDDVTTQLIEDDDVTTQQTEDDDVRTQQTVDDDDVTTQQKEDDDVTTQQIEGHYVTTQQIEDDYVIAQQLNYDDVTTQQIDVKDDDVTTQQLKDDDVTTQQIEDDDVTTQQKEDDDVTTQHIDVKDDDDVVTTQQIEDDNATKRQMGDDNVTTHQIEDGDVTGNEKGGKDFRSITEGNGDKESSQSNPNDTSPGTQSNPNETSPGTTHEVMSSVDLSNTEIKCIHETPAVPDLCESGTDWVESGDGSGMEVKEDEELVEVEDTLFVLSPKLPFEAYCSQDASDASLTPGGIKSTCISSPENPESIKSVFKLPISVSPIRSDQQQDVSIASHNTEECHCQTEEAGSCCSDLDNQPKSQVSDFKEEEDLHLCWSQAETGSSSHASLDWSEEEIAHAQSSTAGNPPISTQDNTDERLGSCHDEVSFRPIERKSVSGDNSIEQYNLPTDAEGGSVDTMGFQDVDTGILGQSSNAARLVDEMNDGKGDESVGEYGSCSVLEDTNSNDNKDEGVCVTEGNVESVLLKSKENVNDTSDDCCQKYSSDCGDDVDTDKEISGNVSLNEVSNVTLKRCGSESDYVENEFISVKKMKLEDTHLDDVADSPSPIQPLVASLGLEHEEDSDLDIDLFPASNANQSRKRKHNEHSKVESTSKFKRPADSTTIPTTNSTSSNLTWTPIQPLSGFSPLLSAISTPLSKLSAGSSCLPTTQLSGSLLSLPTSTMSHFGVEESPTKGHVSIEESPTMSPLIGNQNTSLTVCPTSSPDMEADSNSKDDGCPHELVVKQICSDLTKNIAQEDTGSGISTENSIGALSEIRTNDVDVSSPRSSLVSSLFTSSPSSKFEEEENDLLVVSTPPEQRRAKRESLYTAVIQELQRMNKDIRMFLSKDKPNVDQAIEVLEDLQDTPINLTALIKFPPIMETLNKCRRYKQSEDVRQLSQRIYDRFKALLL